jgi:hypothetical protein
MGRGRSTLLQRGLDETTHDAGAVDDGTGDPRSNWVRQAREHTLSNGRRSCPCGRTTASSQQLRMFPLLAGGHCYCTSNNGIHSYKLGTAGGSTVAPGCGASRCAVGSTNGQELSSSCSRHQAVYRLRLRDQCPPDNCSVLSPSASLRHGSRVNRRSARHAQERGPVYYASTARSS